MLNCRHPSNVNSPGFIRRALLELVSPLLICAIKEPIGPLSAILLAVGGLTSILAFMMYIDLYANRSKN